MLWILMSILNTSQAVEWCIEASEKNAKMPTKYVCSTCSVLKPCSSWSRYLKIARYLKTHLNIFFYETTLTTGMLIFRCIVYMKFAI